MSASAQSTLAVADPPEASCLVSVVIPCLNEAENIERCVTAAREAIERMGALGEVVVADNNSEDDSARLASEYVELLDSIGDPEMTVGLLFGAIVAKWESGDIAAALRLAQRVIDLADGDVAAVIG